MGRLSRHESGMSSEKLALFGCQADFLRVGDVVMKVGGK